MTSTPWTYDSLKVLLQYMDANKRFEISQCIPSLKNVDRVTPLFIKKLEFCREGFEVNNLTYKIGIVCQSREGSTPQTIEWRNRLGGMFKDIDEFGVKDRAPEQVIYPGDVVLGEMSSESNDMGIRELEDRLQELQRENSTPQYGVIGSIVPQQIEEYQEMLEAHYRRRDNRPANYNFYIQLTNCKNGPFNAIWTEKVHYTRKRPEAMKYLIAKFFDNRSHVTKIGKLTISEKKILRLPINLKLDVRRLDTLNYFPMTLPAIASILNTTNLHSLGCGEIREGDLDNELMKNTRTLMIRGLPEDVDDYSPILIRLENPNVWFPYFGTTSEGTSFIAAIRYWLSNGKKAGTSLIVGIDDEEDMEKLRNEIWKKFGRFSLTMSNNRKLEVSFEYVGDELEEEGDDDEEMDDEEEMEDEDKMKVEDEMEKQKEMEEDEEKKDDDDKMEEEKGIEKEKETGEESEEKKEFDDWVGDLTWLMKITVSL
ncbi:hypothetical protein CAEBREN_21506 [Caenorhabditis brenneri]|uniref:Uncharacterized protein n=1 Tax=Caenorhabditis brenneri TaxID=135651 RepID=G0MDA3_CAEBE|nr:hypothetical protein CAEBREN_21506 [Caenorhabditis brenneri]